MIFTTWNIRGLNESLKQAEVKKLLVLKRCALIGVLETRVCSCNKERMWNKLNLQGWELIDNYSHSDIGKIWVIFDSLKVNVQCIGSSDQFIHCKVNMEGVSFIWTVVYGSNHLVERQRLWKHLVDLSRSIEELWFVQGDFNAVLREEDRCGGSPLDEDHLHELSNCVSAAGLIEIRSVGCQFTWNNNQLGINRIWRKLDRVFANGNVNENFHRIYNEALPCGISDHSPIVTILESEQRSGSRKFKFFNFWTLHPDFRTILEEEWRINYRGFHIYKLVQKLKAISYRLSKLNRSQFSDISKRTDNHREILNRLQVDLQRDPTNTFLIDEERVMSNHFRFLLKCEESYFKQKSRIQWLNLGDSNTKYLS
ncbi:uncharacterized protein LOC126681663 [Mercurialis annua]|uniref:uncharacterized protein LOC126681663 n=1 Tax=Mercurialis annua TaxID=3986 RepID=UPI00215EB730|nr:uncharacterized protein LOC126681663 [Mercurialis annua]